VPETAGAHAERIGRMRELLAAKGRRTQQRFAFEGLTLLEEALRAGVRPQEIYVTQSVFDRTAAVRSLDADGCPVFVVDERTMRKISDVETPSGVVAAAPARFSPPAVLLTHGLTLVLAGVTDPGNAGTLLRSAEAFGAAGAIFGEGSVDPYNPKVVRGAMGAHFRLPLATATPDELAAALRAAKAELLGLDAGGSDLQALVWPPRAAIAVGSERGGLAGWEPICSCRIAVPMPGPAESLNAAVAGSIALYEAFRARTRAAKSTKAPARP
jgi:TrmH family RNA methyltransferase